VEHAKDAAADAADAADKGEEENLTLTLTLALIPFFLSRKHTVQPNCL